MARRTLVALWVLFMPLALAVVLPATSGIYLDDLALFPATPAKERVSLLRTVVGSPFALVIIQGEQLQMIKIDRSLANNTNAFINVFTFPKGARMHNQGMWAAGLLYFSVIHPNEVEYLYRTNGSYGGTILLGMAAPIPTHVYETQSHVFYWIKADNESVLLYREALPNPQRPDIFSQKTSQYEILPSDVVSGIPYIRATAWTDALYFVPPMGSPPYEIWASNGTTDRAQLFGSNTDTFELTSLASPDWQLLWVTNMGTTFRCCPVTTVPVSQPSASPAVTRLDDHTVVIRQTDYVVYDIDTGITYPFTRTRWFDGSLQTSALGLSWALDNAFGSMTVTVFNRNTNQTRSLDLSFANILASSPNYTTSAIAWDEYYATALLVDGVGLQIVVCWLNSSADATNPIIFCWDGAPFASLEAVGFGKTTVVAMDRVGDDAKSIYVAISDSAGVGMWIFNITTAGQAPQREKILDFLPGSARPFNFRPAAQASAYKVAIEYESEITKNTVGITASRTGEPLALPDLSTYYLCNAIDSQLDAALPVGVALLDCMTGEGSELVSVNATGGIDSRALFYSAVNLAPGGYVFIRSSTPSDDIFVARVSASGHFSSGLTPLNMSALCATVGTTWDSTVAIHSIHEDKSATWRLIVVLNTGSIVSLQQSAAGYNATLVYYFSTFYNVQNAVLLNRTMWLGLSDAPRNLVLYNVSIDSQQTGSLFPTSLIDDFPGIGTCGMLLGSNNGTELIWIGTSIRILVRGGMPTAETYVGFEKSSSGCPNLDFCGYINGKSPADSRMVFISGDFLVTLNPNDYYLGLSAGTRASKPFYKCRKVPFTNSVAAWNDEMLFITAGHYEVMPQLDNIGVEFASSESYGPIYVGRVAPGLNLPTFLNETYPMVIGNISNPSIVLYRERRDVAFSRDVVIERDARIMEMPCNSDLFCPAEMTCSPLYGKCGDYAPACSPPQPLPSFICDRFTWVSLNTVTISNDLASSTNLTIAGQVSIRGNLSIDSATVPPQQVVLIFQSNAVISVDGCVSIAGSVAVEAPPLGTITFVNDTASLPLITFDSYCSGLVERFSTLQIIGSSSTRRSAYDAAATCQITSYSLDYQNQSISLVVSLQPDPACAPSGCIGTAPSPQFVCIGTEWVSTTSTTVVPIDSGTLNNITIGGTVRISGNFTIDPLVPPQQVVLIIKPGSQLVVEGCVAFGGTILIELDSSALPAKANTTSNITILSFETYCSVNMEQFAIMTVDTSGMNLSPCQTTSSELEYLPKSLSLLFQLQETPRCEPPAPGTPPMTAATIAGIIISICVALVVVVVVVVMYRGKIQAQLTKDLDDAEDLEMQEAAKAAMALPHTPRHPASPRGHGDTQYTSIDVNGRVTQVNIIPPQEIKLLHPLGHGSFGSVQLALFRSTLVAVKQLLTSNKQQVDSFLAEAALHTALPAHRNICAVHGICIEGSGSDASEKYSLVIEYCPNGSLDHYLASDHADPEMQEMEAGGYGIFKIIYGVAAGMAEIAKAGVVHRDLSARNVLLDENLYPKIADMGMSRIVGSADSDASTNSNFGPIRWMAPENIRDKTYSQKSDVWSYGCLIIEAITGDVPYAAFEQDLAELAVEIRDRNLTPLEDFIDWLDAMDTRVPRWIRDILEKTFELDPNERPSFSEVCEFLEKVHPEYFAKYLNDLDKALAVDLHGRSGSATAVKAGRASAAAIAAAAGTRLVGSAALEFLASSNSLDFDSSEEESDEPSPDFITTHAFKHAHGQHRYVPDLASAKILAELGSGSFGTVFLAKMDGRFVAIKQMTHSSGKTADLMKEAVIMKHLTSHRNIISIYGVRTGFGDNGPAVEIIMEFAQRGSLFDYINREVDTEHGIFMSTKLMYRFALGVARGMASLAADGIVHRDLAARNVLIDSYLEPKVSDFGFARQLSSDDANHVGHTNSSIGPIRWMAPESIKTMEYSEKSDVWMYGCLLFEMITGETPYHDMELIDVALAVKNGNLNPLVYYKSRMSFFDAPNFIVDLAEMIFEHSPDNRPSFDFIVHWLETNAPPSILKAEARRLERRKHREDILAAMDKIVVT